MEIKVKETEVRVENGYLIIKLDPETEEKLTAKKLSDKVPGDVFKIGETEFIVLEQLDGKTACVTKDFVFESKFGADNNFVGSIVEKKILDWLKEFEKTVGEDNILEHEIDLVSLDGLDDYGKITRKASLLTVDQYRKYHKILGLKSNYPNWWWTITPDSTPSNDCTSGVCYVFNNGSLDYNDCGWDRGVRPFLIFNSSIFVS